MNLSSRKASWSPLLGVAALLAACSSSPPDPSPSSGGSTPLAGSSSGGSSASGGSSGLGGANVAGAAANGGSAGSSGNSSQGGSSNSGGAPNTAGASGGGAFGNGGSAAGGRQGSAGNSSGGSAGAAAGASAMGGQATGGTNGGGAAGFEPCPASGVCKIMPLGDSITEGTGYAGGYRVELFAKAVADKKNITFVGSLSNGPNTISSGVTFPKSHEGHFGWTISQVDGRIPDPALNAAPHIVLLHLGTNDINQNMLSGAPERLGSLVDQIIAKLPSALIVVAKIIPEPSQASGITTLNNAIPQLVQTRASAGKHVILVDQFSGFLASELGDGVHPNQAGYARMAGVWYTAVKGYLH